MVINNNRIVVVGASDAGIGFIETLLSIRHVQYSNITLIAPGGLKCNKLSKDLTWNLKAESTSYTHDEIEKMLLDSKITVIDDRMLNIDRNSQYIILASDTKVP
jgi:NADH dehydrogenase FAD-containing subunit